MNDEIKTDNENKINHVQKMKKIEILYKKELKNAHTSNTV